MTVKQIAAATGVDVVRVRADLRRMGVYAKLEKGKREKGKRNE
jgi:hypothetical protein